MISQAGLSVIRFGTEWSGACQIFDPIYTEISAAYGNRIRFFSVNSDEEKTLSAEFGVREWPTLIFFRNGQITDYVTGMISRSAFVAKIENFLSQHINTNNSQNS